jgi:hypothetical protein
MMKPIQVAPLSPEQTNELSQLYRTTRDVRLRTRAQMILLAAEQGMSAPGIAAVVRESDQTVCNWLKRYAAEGIEGLKDAPAWFAEQGDPRVCRPIGGSGTSPPP